MGAKKLQVRLTLTAIGDLEEIDRYWSSVGEPERGERYVRDLFAAAERELSGPEGARRGRIVRLAPQPETREILVYKGSYRIIYRLDLRAGVVHVLRFWHSHRDTPELE